LKKTTTNLQGKGRMTWGRCYDHNFLRFFPIFREKIGVFSKTNVMINFFTKFSFVLSQKTPIFSKKFSAKIFEKSVPETVSHSLKKVISKSENFFTRRQKSHQFGLTQSSDGRLVWLQPKWLASSGKVEPNHPKPIGDFLYIEETEDFNDLQPGLCMQYHR
jgi:hypothetical protein